MKPSSRFLTGETGWEVRPLKPYTDSPMPKEQPQEYPVTVEIEGKRYTGFYTVSSGVVTVESDWGERSAQGGARVEETARYYFLKFFGVQRCRLRCRRHVMSLSVEKVNYDPEERRD